MRTWVVCTVQVERRELLGQVAALHHLSGAEYASRVLDAHLAALEGASRKVLVTPSKTSQSGIPSPEAQPCPHAIGECVYRVSDGQSCRPGHCLREYADRHPSASMTDRLAGGCC